MPVKDVLSPRALNRAMLERQLLLQRCELPVVDAVERLVGLNAQDPNPPYLALWNRLESFAIEDLTAAIEHRTVVRSTLMRATQHIVSVADFRLIRPVVAPLLRRVQRNGFGRRTAGIDLDALVAEARALLADGRTLTRPELGRLLAEHHPGADATALAWTIQYLEPLIHPAPSGTWNSHGPVLITTANWTSTPPATGDAPEDGVVPGASGADVGRVIRRYLAAFGPATVADARSWSGVAGLRTVFEQLRPELRVYADESGRELFDVPDAPEPVADQPAPVRFLPPFDAPVLAYADRTRVMTDEVRRQVIDGAAVSAVVLVDGTVAATWTIAPADEAVELTVRPLRTLSSDDLSAVEAEGYRLLAFVTPDAEHHVRDGHSHSS